MAAANHSSTALHNTFSQNKPGVRFADLADKFAGQWVSGTGAPVASIDGGTMTGSQGTVVKLEFKSESACCFTLNGQMHTGELSAQHGSTKLHWSHGEVWTKSSPALRAVGPKAAAATVPQRRPKVVEEDSEEK